MAEIKPLRAWRYTEEHQSNIENLVSPLFDVVSQKQRERLYANKINSIHLSVPAGTNAADNASETLNLWKEKGIIKQDDLPSIYVYYQYFRLPGEQKEYCRKGFIANLRVYDWDEGVLLRHENTMPYSVNDRMELLEKTQLNVSPTHGLYTDPSMSIEKHLDDSMVQPLYETEDYQGVRDVFSVIHDAEVINSIIRIIRNKKIILADGHHRYEGSLYYQKKCQDENPNHSGMEGYNYHLMWFTNTEADDLRILPTHRLISGLNSFSKNDFLNNLSNYFYLKELEEPSLVPEVILGKPNAFGLLLEGQAYQIQLKEELIDTITWNFPSTILKLDLTVLHYFIIEKCFGILGKDQRSSTHLSFERNFIKCHEDVKSGNAQCAIIAQEISIDTIKEVCYSGFTLPQKSTYFYPKVICGFLFGSIKDDEFNSFFDEAFE